MCHRSDMGRYDTDRFPLQAEPDVQYIDENNVRIVFALRVFALRVFSVRVI